MEHIVNCLGKYMALDHDQALSMPPEFYTSEEFFEVEQTQLFHGEWVCLGRTEQIPKVGDYFATELLNEPLIVVRTKLEEIKILSNVCRHRGTVLVEGTGNTNNFICPYHAWSYSLYGHLRRAPLIKDRNDFDQ